MSRSAARSAGRLAAALVAAALPAPVAAAAVQPQPRIYGGTPAAPAEYPFHAFVRIDDFQCGGSLIAARYVVTAGHCVDGTSDVATLAIGVTSVRGGLGAVPAERRFTGRVIRNPAYGSTGGLLGLGGGAPVNDVAVLRLDRPAPFEQLRLPRPQDAPLWLSGVLATAIGFGTTETGRTSEDLLEVELPIVADADCADVFGPDYRPATNVCAGYREARGRDTCTGDSGGPLLAPDGAEGLVLAGVTSFGSEQCGSAYGAYAEVGSPQLNDFLRAVVPQAEITPEAATPLEGERVTFTAQLRDPDGRGPFGGYDAVAWDLDADGTFDEAVGATSVTVRAREGVNRVAVAASDAIGNREVRRVRVVGRPAAHVAFARRRMSVSEGATLRLRVVKTGQGAGTVRVRPSRTAGRRLRSSEAVTATFGSARRVRVVRFRTRDDDRRRRARTFTVTLRAATGELRPGTPRRVRVRVRDDDR